MAIITFKDADGVEQTLDTAQKFNIAFHADCRDVLRAMPDKCIDLIVADPPYGDGNPDNDTEHRNQRGRFDKYNDSSQTVNVDRERSAPTYNRFGSPGSRFERYKPDASFDSTAAGKKSFGKNTSDAVARTGGTWAEKYGKKS